MQRLHFCDAAAATKENGIDFWQGRDEERRRRACDGNVVGDLNQNALSLTTECNDGRRWFMKPATIPGRTHGKTSS